MTQSVMFGEVEGVRKDREVLRTLLGRAEAAKPDGGIEPAITEGDFEGELEALTNAEDKPKETANMDMETALREQFYQTLETQSIDDPRSGIWNLLDISLILSNKGACEHAMTFWLIEELLESQTIEGCRTVFNFLESRRDALLAKNYVPKKLVILRACNELLKRLSRAEDTVFCGRVFIYLFQCMAFGDKSAVNLRGEFHTANVTSYDHDFPADTMEVDQKETPADDSSKAEAKPSTLSMEELYPVFWSLQEYFSNPTKLFLPENLEKFKSGIDATLAKFKEIQNDAEPSGSTEEGRSKKRMREAEGGVVEGAFNPKYLTNPDLFELEISDLDFRRHFLVQALIIIDFLLAQTPKAKSKLEQLKNKSVLYSFTLNDTETEWATGKKGEIASYLQRGKEGKFYHRMVDTVLCRDKNWVYWKAEACPSFSRPAVTASEFREAQQGAKRACAPKRLKAKPMGALDLDFLQETSDAEMYASLKDPEQWQVPAMDAYRRALQEDELNMDFADAEEKAQLMEAKASKLWRTLRIAQKTHFSKFDKLDDGNKWELLFEEEKAPEEEEEEAAESSKEKDETTKEGERGADTTEAQPMEDAGGSAEDAGGSAEAETPAQAEQTTEKPVAMEGVEA